MTHSRRTVGTAAGTHSPVLQAFPHLQAQAETSPRSAPRAVPLAHQLGEKEVRGILITDVPLRAFDHKAVDGNGRRGN